MSQRPQRVNVPPVPFGKPLSAMRFMRNIDTQKYVETLERNQKLNLCCRHVEESGHTAQYFSTPEGAEEGIPDILVIVCGSCGRKHTRFFVGGGERTVIQAR